MPIKKTTITKICTLLKIDQAKFEAAMNAKTDEDIEIADDLLVLTKAEATTRDKNQYETGKKAGYEMNIKELSKKHELDYTGDDPEKFIESLQKKIRAELDKNPDARIAEMQKILDAAKTNLKKANDRADALEAEKTTLQADTELLALLPADRLETMTNEEYLALTKAKIKIEMRDGKKVVVKEGQPVLDAKTMEPIPAANAIRGYFGERKWIKDPDNPNDPKGGRGGGNSTPGGKPGRFNKLSEVHEYVKSQGVNPLGEEGQRMMQAAIKENETIDMNH